LIKEQAEKIQQLQGADVHITNLQTQLDDLRKQNDDLKAKLQEVQSKPFTGTIPSPRLGNDQSAPAQRPTLITQQTPVQPNQPVAATPTPVTPMPTQPTATVQPKTVATEPELVNENSKFQQEEPKTHEGQRSATFGMPQPKLIARDTPPTSVTVQSTQFEATAPQRSGWTASTPSSNSGSLHTSNDANTNNNIAGSSNTAEVMSTTPTAQSSSTPSTTSGNSTGPSHTTTPTINPQPAASGWTKGS